MFLARRIGIVAERLHPIRHRRPGAMQIDSRFVDDVDTIVANDDPIAAAAKSGRAQRMHSYAG